MKRYLACALLLLCVASPAAAERMQFDHRLYAPLREVLDGGDSDMVDFNANNPARLVDLIAVRGRSAHQWLEALEIVSTARPADIAGLTEWTAQVQQQSLARCPESTFATIAQDDVSITFERRSPGCPAEPAPYAIYRLIAGQRSWFRLAVLVKDDLPPSAREQWLAVLASAHLD